MLQYRAENKRSFALPSVCTLQCGKIIVTERIMKKRKLKASEIAKDIKSNFDDVQLMEKYEVPEKALRKIYSKLIEAGIITQFDLNQEERISRTSVKKKNNAQKYKECDFCGEDIFAKARKCKHCGEFLDKPVKQLYHENAQDKDKRSNKGKVVGKNRCHNPFWKLLNIIFGVLLALNAIGSLTTSFISSIIYLAASGFCFPPVRNFLYSKTNIVIPPKIRGVVVLVILLPAAGYFREKEIAENKKIEATERNEKIARYLKDKVSQKSDAQRMKYTILSSQAHIIGNISKRLINVRLERKVTEDSLKNLALKLRKNEPSTYDLFYIFYILPDMEIGNGAWAITHFKPNLKVMILGMTIEEENRLLTQKNCSIR